MSIRDWKSAVAFVIAGGEGNFDALDVTEAGALSVHVFAEQVDLILVKQVLHAAHVHELEDSTRIISMLLRHTQRLLCWHVLMRRDQLRLFLALGGPLHLEALIFDFKAV